MRAQPVSSLIFHDGTLAGKIVPMIHIIIAGRKMRKANFDCPS